VSDLLTGERFRDLFTSFERTAEKLESRDRYSSPLEDRSVRQFLAGEPVDLGWLDGWFAIVRAATTRGKRFARVRVVSEPLSDYKRFELMVCPRTVSAGEEIHYLPRAQADDLGIPPRDFWIFDNERVALLHFSSEDVFLGAELLGGERTVSPYRRWLGLAREPAVPFTTYVRQRPEAAGQPTGQ
jgi:hypothetical protein